RQSVGYTDVRASVSSSKTEGARSGSLSQASAPETRKRGRESNPAKRGFAVGAPGIDRCHLDQPVSVPEGSERDRAPRESERGIVPLAASVLRLAYEQ